MTPGRLLVTALLLTALAAGAGMYYLQVYAYYREVAAPPAIALAGAGDLVPESFQGIDSDSSPIRYRACFTLPRAPHDAALVRYDDPRPPNAPWWFDCFDAPAIGEALEAGEATAYLGTPDDPYGIDEVVALFPDGRAYAWRQINACGEVVFDGDPPPESCPPLPESTD